MATLFGLAATITLLALTSPSFADESPFPEIMKQLRSGLEYKDKEQVYETKDLVYFATPIKMEGAEDIFYTQRKASKMTHLTIGFSLGKMTKEKFVSEVESTTGVELKEIANKYDYMTSYLIQERMITIGVLEVLETENAVLYEFYRFPGDALDDALDRMGGQVNLSWVDDYKGKKIHDELPMYGSAYQAPESNRTFFLDRGDTTYMYSEFAGIKKYVWLAVFNQTPSPLKAVGYKKVAFVGETTTNGQLQHIYSARRNDRYYLIEVWEALHVGIASVYSPPVPEGMEHYRVPVEHIKKSATYIESMLRRVQSLGDILERAVEISSRDYESAQIEMKSATWETTSLYGNSLVNISDEIDKAVEAANKYNCEDNKDYLENFDTAISELYRAAGAFRTNTEEFIHAKSDLADAGNAMNSAYSNMREKAIKMSKWYSDISYLGVCFVPKGTIVNKPNNSSTVDHSKEGYSIENMTQGNQ